MKKVWILPTLLILACAGLVVGQVVIMQRPLTTLGLSSGVGYGTRVPVVTDDGRPPTDGEIFVVRNAGTADPDLQVYSQVSGGWLTALVSGGTDAVSLSTDLTLGNNDVDDITVNGPMSLNVLREDFNFQPWSVVEEDYTAAVVTDVGENLLFLHGAGQIPVIWYSFEQAFAGTLTPFTVAGVLDVSGFVDTVDTDGVDFTFGGDPTTAIYYDEDNSSSTYCETSITIATIANIDEMYFGWRLAAGRFDTNDITGINTGAWFRVPDNAGDIDIETQLNAGGGVENDDTGATWANAASHVLRVTLLADTVTFTYDGTAVTQTNAVLNLDATDRMVCFFGTQMSAVGATAGMTMDYIEIGISQ